jgi:MGT family glycosyltransferase
VALTLFPPTFEAVQPISPLHRFRLERSKAAPPLPNWWPDRQGPFVYVTLGMVTGGFDVLRAAYRATLDALATLPIRALLTIGMDLPLEVLGKLPANVHVERFVPQDDVIPHAAAVLCHGGSGTVLGALAAGTPLVITPMFADQPYNASRVAALGAGLTLPTGIPNPQALSSALTRVTTEAEFRIAAQKTAREIAALPSLDDAAQVIERRALGV